MVVYTAFIPRVMAISALSAALFVNSIITAISATPSVIRLMLCYSAIITCRAAVPAVTALLFSDTKVSAIITFAHFFVSFFVILVNNPLKLGKK